METFLVLLLFVATAGIVVGITMLIANYTKVWSKKTSMITTAIGLLGLIVVLGVIEITPDNQSSQSASSSETTSTESSTATDSDDSSNVKIKKVNKEINKVGNVQYKITNIATEKVTNDKSNWKDAEYNLSDDSQLHDSYYRVTIGYNLKNVGDKAIDTVYGETSVITGDNQDFNRTGSVGGYCFDEGVSDTAVQPGTSKVSDFVLISNDPINTDKITLNVGAQCDPSGNQVASGGTATYIN